MKDEEMLLEYIEKQGLSIIVIKKFIENNLDILMHATWMYSGEEIDALVEEKNHDKV